MASNDDSVAIRARLANDLDFLLGALSRARTVIREFRKDVPLPFSERIKLWVVTSTPRKLRPRYPRVHSVHGVFQDPAAAMKTAREYHGPERKVVVWSLDLGESGPTQVIYASEGKDGLIESPFERPSGS